MAEPLTLYKLIILYMLKKVDFPLTNAQISEFVLDQEYTTYFTLQQAIAMCNHWGKRCQEIYEYVMGTLLTEPKSE